MSPLKERGNHPTKTHTYPSHGSPARISHLSSLHFPTCTQPGGLTTCHFLMSCNSRLCVFVPPSPRMPYSFLPHLPSSQCLIVLQNSGSAAPSRASPMPQAAWVAPTLCFPDAQSTSTTALITCSLITLTYSSPSQTIC